MHEGEVDYHLGLLQANLDIEGTLVGANIYHLILTSSHYGKGEIATEFRILATQVAKSCASHYENSESRYVQI